MSHWLRSLYTATFFRIGYGMTNEKRTVQMAVRRRTRLYKGSRGLIYFDVVTCRKGKNDDTCQNFADTHAEISLNGIRRFY